MIYFWCGLLGFAFGLMAGLYFGERGRRLDAYRALSHPATPGLTPDVLEEDLGPYQPTAETVDRLKQEYLDEGFTPQEAEEAIGRLFAQINQGRQIQW